MLKRGLHLFWTSGCRHLSQTWAMQMNPYLLPHLRLHPLLKDIHTHIYLYKKQNKKMWRSYCKITFSNHKSNKNIFFELDNFRQLQLVFPVRHYRTKLNKNGFWFSSSLTSWPTYGISELLLSDLLQLEDLLQSLRDLGPSDAHLLALPALKFTPEKCVIREILCAPVCLKITKTPLSFSKTWY